MTLNSVLGTRIFLSNTPLWPPCGACTLPAATTVVASRQYCDAILKGILYYRIRRRRLSDWMLFAGYMRGRGRPVNKGGTSQIGGRRRELQSFQSVGLN